MSGNGEVDQCPFCNAAWGDCLHVQLLAELDNEAAARANAKLAENACSTSNANVAAKKTASTVKAIKQVDPNKTIFGSR